MLEDYVCGYQRLWAGIGDHQQGSGENYKSLGYFELLENKNEGGNIRKSRSLHRKVQIKIYREVQEIS
jgi:hypothetical protein